MTDDPRHLFELARQSEAGGEDALAERLYIELLDGAPDFAEAHHNLARLLRRQDRDEEAFGHAETAARLSPDHAVLQMSLGVSAERTGRTDHAIASYLKALELRPDYGQAAGNLARLYVSGDEPAKALSLLEPFCQAGERQPALVVNLANAYLETGAPEKAIDLLDDAEPEADMLATWENSRGSALYIRRDWRAARAAFERAIAADPDFAEAHENLAHCHFQMGNWVDGWREFDWRWRNPANRQTKRVFDGAAWDGSPLKGRRLLLHAEQGLGDTIQFIRYAAEIPKGGAPSPGKVVLWCPDSLAPVLAPVAGIDSACGFSASPGSFDCQAPLMNLPRLLGREKEFAADGVPYVPVPADQRKPDLPNDVLHVGICWRGRPRHGSDPYRNRSCPPSLFKELAERSDAHFYSLVPSPSGEEAEILNASSRITDWGDATTPFSAALPRMAALDLVITVDTAVGHLAGAMGKPCWVVLPYTADWRWGGQQEKCRWYRSMRLFRQSEPGGWSVPFEQIAHEIEHFQA